MRIVKFEQDNCEFVEVNMNEEPCPICGTSFNESYCGWNMFHGEVTYSCCKSPYQIKDYYVGDKYSQELREFVGNIGKDGKIILKIKSKWIEPLRKAIDETGIKDIDSDNVGELAEKYFKELA